MPIKWTPETDQILLLKILETSQLNADVKAISAAWPDNLEKPTPRAITERLVRIRQTAKTNGSATHFSVSNAKSGKGAAITPRKRPNPSPTTPKSSPKKAKATTPTPEEMLNDPRNAQNVRDDYIARNFPDYQHPFVYDVYEDTEPKMPETKAPPNSPVRTRTTGNANIKRAESEPRAFADDATVVDDGGPIVIKEEVLDTNDNGIDDPDIEMEAASREYEGGLGDMEYYV